MSNFKHGFSILDYMFRAVFILANPQVFGCKCMSINTLRNVLLYFFCDVTFDYREHSENSQLYVPEICHWLFYPKHYILGPYELVINNDAIKFESVSIIPA